MKDLKQCREEIDLVDRQLVELFQKRMHIAEEIAAYKSPHEMNVLHSAREEEKLNTVRSLAEPDYEDATAELYEKIMELSRRQQKERL